MMPIGYRGRGCYPHMHLLASRPMAISGRALSSNYVCVTITESSKTITIYQIDEYHYHYHHPF